MKMLVLLQTGIALGASVASASIQGDQARSLIHRENDFAVRQLVSPGFENLPLRRRIFAYYISRAIDMGRDIVWLQSSREGLAIRKLVHALWLESRHFDLSQKRALEEYYFRLLANHSNYDDRKTEKFIPVGLSPDQFLQMAQIADSNARKAGAHSSSWEKEAIRLQRHIFDLDYFRELVASSPRDLLADSASNYYEEGITREEVEARSDIKTHFLSQVVREPNGNLDLRYYRMGDRFSEQLSLIDHFLSKALDFASPEEKKIIEAERKVLRTGDPEDLKAAQTLWVQHRSDDIDFVLGFIEQYADPLGARGEWEGFLLMKAAQPAAVTRIQNIRKAADYFESINPYDDKYRKPPGSTPPQAEGAYIVHSGGANGERPFSGVNLPNWKEIQEKYGSKSFTSKNVMSDIGDLALTGDKAREIDAFYSPVYRDRVKNMDMHLSEDIQVEFHEILGHGSSKNLPGVQDSDLGEFYSALEEGRAETASLYHLVDSRLRELGILPKDWSLEQAREFAELTVVRFFVRHLRTYEKLGESAVQIRQAHQWGRQAMMNWLIHHGSLRVVLSEGGVPMPEVVNLDLVRKHLGEFWRQIQAAKSEGRIDLAEQILSRWGEYADTHRNWRRAIIETVKALNLPRESIYLNPQWKVVRGEDGQIQNVFLEYESPETAGWGRLFEREQQRLENDYAGSVECARALGLNDYKL